MTEAASELDALKVLSAYIALNKSLPADPSELVEFSKQRSDMLVISKDEAIHVILVYQKNLMEFRQGKIKVSIERERDRERERGRAKRKTEYSQTPGPIASGSSSRFQYPKPAPVSRAKSFRSGSVVHREPSRKRKKKRLKKRKRQRHRHTIHSKHTAKISYDDMDLQYLRDEVEERNHSNPREDEHSISKSSSLRSSRHSSDQRSESIGLKPAVNGVHPRKPTPYTKSSSVTPKQRNYRSAGSHKNKSKKIKSKPKVHKQRSLWSLKHGKSPKSSSKTNHNGNGIIYAQSPPPRHSVKRRKKNASNNSFHHYSPRLPKKHSIEIDDEQSQSITNSDHNDNAYLPKSIIREKSAPAPTPNVTSGSDSEDHSNSKSRSMDDLELQSGMITPIHDRSFSNNSGHSGMSGDSNHSTGTGIPVWNPLMIGSSPLPQTVRAMEVMDEMKEAPSTNNVNQFVSLHDEVEDLKQSINYMKKMNHEEMQNMNKVHQQQMEAMAAEIDRLRRSNRNKNSSSNNSSSPSLRHSQTEEAMANSAQPTDTEIDDAPRETDDIWETDLDFVDYIMSSPDPPDDPPLQTAERKQSASRSPRYNLGMKRLPSDGGADGCLSLWGNGKGNGSNGRRMTDGDIYDTGSVVISPMTGPVSPTEGLRKK